MFFPISFDILLISFALQAKKELPKNSRQSARKNAIKTIPITEAWEAIKGASSLPQRVTLKDVWVLRERKKIINPKIINDSIIKKYFI